MKSKNIQYYSRIDHLRFFAAFLVLAGHKNILPNGWGPSGVSLFLVLSGFLFALITQCGQKEIDYKTFIFNRILRIYPLFVFLFFVMLSIGRKDFVANDLLHLLFLQTNIGNDVTGFGYEIVPFFGPMWTISVEFQFYLILPFVLSFFHKKGIQYIILLILFVILMRGMTYLTTEATYWTYYHTILGRMDQFLIGILLAALYINQRFRLINITYFILSILLLAFVLNTSFKMNPVIGFPLEALTYGFVIVTYLSLSMKIPKWVDITLSKLGMISYSIYLLHLLVLCAIPETGLYKIDFLNKLDGWAKLFVVELPIVLSISYLSFIVIEQPFLSFRKSYLKPSVPIG